MIPFHLFHMRKIRGQNTCIITSAFTCIIYKTSPFLVRFKTSYYRYLHIWADLRSRSVDKRERQNIDHCAEHHQQLRKYQISISLFRQEHLLVIED